MSLSYQIKLWPCWIISNFVEFLCLYQISQTYNILRCLLNFSTILIVIVLTICGNASQSWLWAIKSLDIHDMSWSDFDTYLVIKNQLDQVAFLHLYISTKSIFNKYFSYWWPWHDCLVQCPAYWFLAPLRIVDNNNKWKFVPLGK